MARPRLWLFLVLFVTMNAAFVPLISLYGLRVCPHLHLSGFTLGCAYSGAYVLIAGLLNLALLGPLVTGHGRAAGRRRRLAAHGSAAYGVVYLVATILALGVQWVVFGQHHLSGRTRAPEVLLLASVLLGITQAYGLTWAVGRDSPEPTSAGETPLRSLWVAHLARTVTPIAVALAVVTHFLLRQSAALNRGAVAPVLSTEEMIGSTSSLLAFLLAWLAVTFLFHFLSERDQALAVQTHLGRLRDLDLTWRTPTAGAWGLWSAILDSLNALALALGERTRLLRSFSRFVTGSVARQALDVELKETVGVARELTLVMSDVRDFTALAERLSPGDTVQLLNAYFTAMLDEVSRYHLVVDKFIGDGLLAYVEADPATGQTGPDAENRLAVLAALAMLARLEQLNQDQAAAGRPRLRIGVGIHRGPLVIGLIGSEARLQHTVIGDSVNRTARLEGLCKELHVPVVLSADVWSTLPADLQALFRSFGERAVKGISIPVSVYGGPIEPAPPSPSIPDPGAPLAPRPI